MLGEKDKIVMVGFAQSAWAEKINPDLANIPAATNAKSPNIEELLNLDIDVVFTWSDAEPLEAMSNAGIPALSSLASSSLPTSAEEYVAGMKKEVNLYAETLGKNAMSRADKYCKYLDEIIERVTSVTSTLSESNKPNVYYIRGPEILTTHGKYSNTRWYVEMAGGNMLSKDLEPTIASVDVEQVITWDPDIIMMGRLASTDPVVNDPAWSEITAVKTGKVYVNPDGVFYWDYGSEGALFLLYLAKTFHPDKFTDIDMVKELKDYYADFYGYKLTDDEAEKILKHLVP
jgi:iron complex transport system substrate-binding protein